MNLTVVALGLFDPLYIAIGWFMRIIYDVVNDYGLMIIIFTIIVRGLMIPLGINSQKSSIKQRSLQGEIAEIQRAYPKDKAKQSELQMELYKKNGASPFAGCLPSILQMGLMLVIWQIIRKPLEYVMNVSAENIGKIGSMLFDKSFLVVNDTATAASTATNAIADNILVINSLNEHSSALASAVNQGFMKASQLIDLNFLGMDLGLTPAWQPAILFGPDWKTYVPLLIWPLLTIITSVIQMKITQMTMPNRKKNAEDKAREKINPARKGQTPEDKSDSMMKTMTIIMPVIMLLTTFSLPAAMGLYWIIGNLVAILQSYLIYFLITKKLNQAGQETDKAKEIRATNS